MLVLLARSPALTCLFVRDFTLLGRNTSSLQAPFLLVLLGPRACLWGSGKGMSQQPKH